MVDAPPDARPTFRQCPIRDVAALINAGRSGAIRKELFYYAVSRVAVGVDELGHFLVLLEEDLVLFLFLFGLLLVVVVAGEFPHLLFVVVDALLDLLDSLLVVRDDVVVLLDSREQAVTRLRETQVRLVELDLEVALLAVELQDLVLQQLSLELLRVHLEGKYRGVSR